MSTETVNYLDAIAQLPMGATLLLWRVSWEEYEALLSDLTEWPGLRVSYDAGRVEIMSPSLEHEEYKDTIFSLTRVLALELRIKVESRGSATYKQKRLAKGAEPDTSFYVQNVARIFGKRRIDLTVDPPPDVVVEIDTTNESLGKFRIYAALGVPEIWRYDGRVAQFFQLAGTDYEEIENSCAFPMLTASVLTEFVELSKTQGQSDALDAIREWARRQATNVKE
jgi:Uma2 family endonuclease